MRHCNLCKLNMTCARTQSVMINSNCGELGSANSQLTGPVMSSCLQRHTDDTHLLKWQRFSEHFPHWLISASFLCCFEALLCSSINSYMLTCFHASLSCSSQCFYMHCSDPLPFPSGIESGLEVTWELVNHRHSCHCSHFHSENLYYSIMEVNRTVQWLFSLEIQSLYGLHQMKTWNLPVPYLPKLQDRLYISLSLVVLDLQRIILFIVCWFCMSSLDETSLQSVSNFYHFHHWL